MALIYGQPQTTVSSIAHLDPKQINLKILVWLKKKKPGNSPTIIKVCCFERRRGREVRAVGRDTKRYDRVYIPGQTMLHAYSF